MKHLSLVVLGLTVFGAGAFLLGYARQAPPGLTSRTPVAAAPSRAVGKQDDSGELGREVASLRRDLLNLRGQVAQAQAREQDAPPSLEAQGAPAPVETREQLEERAKLERQEFMAKVSASFRAEPTDASWSREMSATVRETFEGDKDVGPLVRSIECKSRTCRVELTGERTTESDKTLPLLIHRVGTSLPNMQASHEEDENGHHRMVMYLSRS
jgi:hypothetical protein